MSKLVGDGKISEVALQQMARLETVGTRWAAFQNMDLSSGDCGDLRFLAVGPYNTLKVAPERYPDSAIGVGWRYLFVGWVDFGPSTNTGKVVEGGRLSFFEAIIHRPGAADPTVSVFNSAERARGHCRSVVAADKSLPWEGVHLHQVQLDEQGERASWMPLEWRFDDNQPEVR